MQVRPPMRQAQLVTRPADFDSRSATQQFLLRAVEGFTYREIAESLQMPIGTVMSHLARSRAKMRERLAGYAEASGFLRRSTA